MNRSEALAGIAPAVAHRAVEWLVELQSGSAGDAERQAHRDWLAQHPDHRRAWSHIEAVNARLSGAAGSSAIAHATLAQSPRAPRRRLLTTLAVLGCTAGAAWLAGDALPAGRLVAAWSADARTRVGERRHITLDDGSRIALNTDTAVDLRFSASERRLRLLGGEVLVTTHADDAHPNRPRAFIVETPHGELRPLGTRFSVREQREASRIDVFEGAVAIQPTDGDAALVLRAGERASFNRRVVGDVQSADDAETAWVDGMLVASGMRLDDFLAELGRHRPGRLGCAAEVAHLRVSGTYPLADTDRVLALLQTSLPVEVSQFTRWWVTVRPSRS